MCHKDIMSYGKYVSFRYYVIKMCHRDIMYHEDVIKILSHKDITSRILCHKDIMSHEDIMCHKYIMCQGYCVTRTLCHKDVS